MKKITNKALLYRAAMVLYDIFAVNAGYWLALVLRFYIGSRFRAGAEYYVEVLGRIWPFYTLAAIGIFFAFHLYNTMWKIAGIKDLNRLLLANLTTAVVMAAGTVLTNNRLPLTIYFIGPVVQFVLITLCRMSIKVILLERDQVRAGRAEGNAMVVGVGTIGQAARHQLDRSGVMKTVCVVDSQSDEQGRLHDGIPVLSLSQVPEALEKYAVTQVTIADTQLREADRKELRRLCGEKKLDLADVTGFAANGADPLSPVNLLQTVSGPVTVSINGIDRAFPDADAAVSAINKRYIVRSVSGTDLRIDLTDNPLIPNDTNEDWVREYREETGEDVSFF